MRWNYIGLNRLKYRSNMAWDNCFLPSGEALILWFINQIHLVFHCTEKMICRQETQGNRDAHVRPITHSSLFCCFFLFCYPWDAWRNTKRNSFIVLKHLIKRRLVLFFPSIFVLFLLFKFHSPVFISSPLVSFSFLFFVL